MTTSPAPFTADLSARLGRLGEVRAVRPLVGGRGGRTFAVDHGHLTSVVHLRTDAARLEREAEATRRAYDAGAGPEVLDVVPEAFALITRWVPGTALTDPELRAPGRGPGGRLEQTGAAVRRLHSAPHDGLAPYDPVAWRAEYLDRADRLPAGVRARLDDDVVHAARERADALVTALVASPAPLVLGHADLVAGNLIAAIGGVVVLDYEYAGACEAAFDLGNLVAGAELDDEAAARLVRAYLDDPDGVPNRDARAALLQRAGSWAEVVRHAWFVWVALGEDLGPERAHWEAWAARTRQGWATQSWAGPTAPE